MATGEDLRAILLGQAQEVERERSMRPVACPNDGTPLIEGGEGSILFCTHDGWQYPRDYDPDIHAGL